ncbi:TPA: MBL fold metallo-hydrolase [Klebsiella pneumoniae]|nr:MBL fold metallo-hydrolase [Klebsiella pneumoniae]
MSSLKSLPILRNQAPGFFRYALGNLVVTALYDGYVTLDPMSLSGITDEERKSDLARQLLPTSGALDTSVNAFLIHNGERLILIDAGSAHFAGPSMGRLLDNIAAAGYKPEDVDTILLTHMHPDHIGGITNDKGEALFVNVKWFTEFGHLNRGDMLTSEQHRCHNEKKKFQRRV